MGIRITPGESQMSPFFIAGASVAYLIVVSVILAIFGLAREPNRNG